MSRRAPLLAPPDLERTRSFSDCVFAVALTLLATVAALPRAGSSAPEVTQFLRGQVPGYLAFAAVFVLIGYLWLEHHRIFGVLRRMEGRTATINLVLLGLVVLLPFPARLLAAYPEYRLTHLLVSSAIAAIGVAQLLLVRHVTSHHELTASTFTRARAARLRRRSQLLPVAFVAAAGLSLIGPWWSAAGWLLLLVGRVALRSRRGADDADAAASDAAEADPGDDEMAAVEARIDALQADAAARGRTLSRAGASHRLASIGRIGSFSDNLYAFAVTVLVLQLDLPEFPVDSEAKLLRFLGARDDPALISYVAGFVVLSTLWLTHCRVLGPVERDDRVLPGLNLAHLIFVAVLPAATLLLSEFAYGITHTVYSLLAVVAWLTLAGVWRYVSGDHRLVPLTLPRRDISALGTLTLTVPVGFLLSLPVAVWAPRLAPLVWAVPALVWSATRRRLGHASPAASSPSASRRTPSSTAADSASAADSAPNRPARRPSGPNGSR